MVKTIELMPYSTFAQSEKRYNEIVLKWLVGVEPDSTLPPNGELSIPVWGWQNGLYFAKIFDGFEAHTRSFIVQHP
jgi:hypothetical protein